MEPVIQLYPFLKHKALCFVLCIYSLLLPPYIFKCNNVSRRINFIYRVDQNTLIGRLHVQVLPEKVVSGLQRNAVLTRFLSQGCRKPQMGLLKV